MSEDRFAFLRDDADGLGQVWPEQLDQSERDEVP